MGRRTSYPPGTFSWVELVTTDAAGAKAFYNGLFGWETEDHDGGDGTVYTTCRLDGAAVCGFYETSPELCPASASTSWTSYVTVADADAAAARASELGGDVIQDAHEVLDAGRVAVLTDPHGAAVAVWQPRSRIGAERVNDVGCLCMNELVTTDIRVARWFYEGLFGWTTEEWDTGPDIPPMVLAKNGATVNASITVNGAGPAYWRPCFTVASTETAIGRSQELGGKVLVEPFEIPDGSLAVVLDPHDALFAIFAGELDP